MEVLPRVENEERWTYQRSSYLCARSALHRHLSYLKRPLDLRSASFKETNHHSFVDLAEYLVGLAGVTFFSLVLLKEAMETFLSVSIQI